MSIISQISQRTFWVVTPFPPLLPSLALPSLAPLSLLHNARSLLDDYGLAHCCYRLANSCCWLVLSLHLRPAEFVRLCPEGCWCFVADFACGLPSAAYVRETVPGVPDMPCQYRIRSGHHDLHPVSLFFTLHQVDRLESACSSASRSPARRL